MVALLRFSVFKLSFSPSGEKVAEGRMRGQNAAALPLTLALSPGFDR
jgi:hypothetical protein